MRRPIWSSAPGAAHARAGVDSDSRLLKDSAISRAVYDADGLGDRQARDHPRAAQARLDSIGGSSGARVAPSLARQLSRDLDATRRGLDPASSSDGVAYGLPTKAGEMVSAGQLVADVADPRPPARPRPRRPAGPPRVRVGQRLLVTFDGLPDRRWEGKSSPSRPVWKGDGREVGEVEGEISDADLSLPPNASVNVQIIAGETHGVLTVPRAAIFRDGGKKFVYRLEDGRARRRDVTVGLVGLNDVEISAGLAERDVVVLPGVVPLSEGLRVAIKRGRRLE